jgi:hypothetical protein
MRIAPWSVSGLLALAVCLLAFSPQDKEIDRWYKAAKVRVAQVQFSTPQGPQAILAETLRELRLIDAGHGALWLEVLYENGDYSLLAPGTFHLIAQGRTPTREVVVSRGSIASLAFPAVP